MAIWAYRGGWPVMLGGRLVLRPTAGIAKNVASPPIVKAPTERYPKKTFGGDGSLAGSPTWRGKQPKYRYMSSVFLVPAFDILSRLTSPYLYAGVSDPVLDLRPLLNALHSIISLTSGCSACAALPRIVMSDSSSASLSDCDLCYRGLIAVVDIYLAFTISLSRHRGGRQQNPRSAVLR